MKQKTNLKSAQGKVVYKEKVGRKTIAVNRSGNAVKVAATKNQLKRAGFPQSVQSKDMMKQGYKSRSNESLGMNNGKASSKSQSYKARRNERVGEKRKLQLFL